jgi:hypothetical protein
MPIPLRRASRSSGSNPGQSLVKVGATLHRRGPFGQAWYSALPVIFASSAEAAISVFDRDRDPADVRTGNFVDQARMVAELGL